MSRNKKKNAYEVSLYIGMGFIVTCILTLLPVSCNHHVEVVKEPIVMTDTLALENQGDIDLYKTYDGQYLVISLDDLKYITKKNRIARQVIKDLESLFARLELPKVEPIKPEVK